MRMKNLLIRVLVIGLVVLWAGANGTLGEVEKEKPRGAPEKNALKVSVQRETRMRASGMIREITASSLIMERNITGEIMEFQLEKPLVGFSVGDKVAISYVQKEGRNIAKRVIKNNSRKASKPIKP